MKHAATRMLFAYWDGLRGERSAPERGEIEPGEIRHILADTFILEIDDHADCRFRLAGTRLCALFGRELRSSRLVDLWAESQRAELIGDIATITGESAGIVGGVSARNGKGEALDLELLLLPLRHRGKPHVRILGALSPAMAPPWLGFSPISDLVTLSTRVIWPSGRACAEMVPAADPGMRRRRFVVHQGGRI